VSKLRENDKGVIGVGVKNSTSDLLIANCDEFIYYDDLVREQKPRRAPRRKTAASAASGSAAQGTGSSTAMGGTSGTASVAAAGAPLGNEAGSHENSDEDKRQEAFDLVLATIEALLAERGDDDKIWGSMVKQALKRRRPGFNESYYGFRSFNRLLEEAAAKKLLTLERDDKSGGYVVRLTAEQHT
jgi:hypothetical protein